MGYQQHYQQACNNPEQFWLEQAEQISWFKAPSTALTKDENNIDRWFPDGVMNTSWLALDHHVEQGRGGQVALYYDSPVTATKRSITYKELLQEVSVFAGALRNQGVEKGDRVIVYMPMVPQAVIAMLACARLGAVHSVVFGGFAPHELAIRIDDAQPKVVVTASCGVELDRILPYKPMVDAAIDQAEHKPECVIVHQRTHFKASEMLTGRDIDWQTAMSDAAPVECTPVKATDPLYILYTSGTTGKPKGVIRDNGGHAVAMKYSMEAIYDQQQGDVFWAASDVGWVVGHSYIVYGPLIAGLSSVLYEGKPVRTPGAGAFWRVCEEYKVKTLFAAPTAFRAIRKEDSQCALADKYDLSSLKTIFAAGERLDPATYEWLGDKLKKPVIDHWWQTETGWAIAGNLVGIEQVACKAGSSTYPVPGFQVAILDESGQHLPFGEQGSVAIKLPLPPGCLPGIWGNQARFVDGYLREHPGYYVSGDGGYFDEDGYLYIMGRTDDIINVAGHRLSTGEMEEIVGKHEAVAECAVIGVADELRGQVPIGLYIVKDSFDVPSDVLSRELVQLVREQLGAVACFRNAMPVVRLPKTRSGKILRKLMRQLADGEEFVVPATIDDPAIIDEVKEALDRKGLLSPQLAGAPIM